MHFLSVLLLNSFDMQTTIPFVFCSSYFVIFWAKGCMTLHGSCAGSLSTTAQFPGPLSWPGTCWGRRHLVGAQGHCLKLDPSQWEQLATGNEVALMTQVSGWVKTQRFIYVHHQQLSCHSPLLLCFSCIFPSLMDTLLVKCGKRNTWTKLQLWWSKPWPRESEYLL